MSCNGPRLGSLPFPLVMPQLLVASSTWLLPPSVTVPPVLPQSPPAVLLATIVFRRVRVAVPLLIPPPLVLALFPLMVTFVSSAVAEPVPVLRKPPPVPALLPLIVLVVIVSVPALRRPPPLKAAPAVLLMIAVAVTASVAPTSLLMPPPLLAAAVLLLMVLLITVKEPLEL